MKEKDIDPVEELHRIRRQICKEAGGTTEDYFRYYLEMDREKVAARKAAEAGATPARTKAVQSKPRRKSAKPAAKVAARKPGQRRKAVTA
jgi:hypothetical protein